jgi:hypothetical protein
MFVYLNEHVVIGPVNHVYAWRATAEKLCPTMILRPSHPTPNRGSRKEVAGWEWFAEPPNNKLDKILEVTRGDYVNQSVTVSCNCPTVLSRLF